MREAVRLPEVACQLFCGRDRTTHFKTDPQELPFKIPQSLDVWGLAMDHKGSAQMPLFDCERIVLYRRSNPCPWRACDRIGSAPGDPLIPTRGTDQQIIQYVLLGPGWESSAIDIYWGLIRKAIMLNKEADPMLAMVYESALVGSK
jgi:hypothetical protein